MKDNLQKKSLYIKSMLSLLMLLLFTGKMAFSQLSGSYSIPGSYASIALAITDLNTQGVGSGGVTFNIASGTRETAPSGGYRLTATGTAANPIVIQVDPNTLPGANVVITAPVGTSTTIDGIFLLLGSDYVTINGIDLQESGANATATTQMEWGYSLLNKNTSAPFDGCNHNTISNCSITLNRTNTISKGINSSHVASNGASTTPTAIGDVHSYNKFYGLKIQNCWTAIYIIGYDDPNAPYTLKDNFNDVGGYSYATADTLTNLGIGTTSTTTTSCGVFTYNQSNLNVSYNLIDNAANGGVGATNMFMGIYAMGSSTSYLCNGTTTFNYNKITVSHIAGSGITYCMNINAYDGDLSISNNDIKWLTTTGAVTGTQYGLYVNQAANTTTGTFTFKYNTAQNFTFNMSTATAYTFYHNGLSQSTLDVGYNTVNNVTRTGGTTGSFYGSYANFAAGATTPNTYTNFYNNTFTNISNVASSTCSFYGFQYGGNYYTNVYNNRIDSISTTGGGSVTTHAMLVVTGSEVNVYNNNISNITGAGTVDAILAQVNSGLNIQRIYNNNIYNITSNIAASTIYGIYNFYGAAVGNYIYKNKIYNLNNTGNTTNSVHGIYIAQGAGGVLSTVPYYIENNIIGGLKAANSTISTTPSVMGMSFNAVSTNPYAAYVRYNNIYLNDVGAANSNSAGIYGVINSTTSVRLNNNLIINNTAHTAGTGMACAIVRSGASLGSYDAASNNNLLYAGTASSRNLFYYDGTSKDSLMSTFKARLYPRESLSFAENTSMFNVANTAANYLQNDTTVATLVEGGAVNISGVTTDIRGVIRQGNTGYAGTGTKPDIGAFESEGTGINMSFDSIIVVKNNNNALLNYNNQPAINIQVYTSGNANTLSATQLDLNASGTVNMSDISKAKIYYTGASNTFAATSQFGSTINSPSYSLIFNGSQALINGNNNFWLTYDIPANATVGNIVDGVVNSVTVSGTTKSPLYSNVSGSKTISAPFNGVYTLGSGPYTTLASIVTALNSNGLSGATTINVPAGFTETAPVGGYVLGSSILNATLSATNTLTFVKSGTGANPLLTANAGTSTTLDGLFIMSGCDYVTIDGIDLFDPTSNASATTQMEWGFALLKFSNTTPFDGCQHNTIKNCTVTLQRINTTSKGIYVNNHIATDVTLLTITSPSDANSYNSFLSNTIQNVNTGIYMNGFGISTSQAITTLYDQYNTVGDTLTGNTIVNFGGAVSGIAINTLNQGNVKYQFNNIDNYDGGRNNAVGSTTSVIGIQHTYTNVSGINITNPTVVGNNVLLTLAQGATGGGTCITIQASHGDIVIKNNSIKLATLGTGAIAGSGLQGLLYNSSQGGGILANSLTFTGNTANNFSFAIGGTGLVNIFTIGGASLNDEISYNTIYNVYRTASTVLGSGAVTLISSTPTSNPAMTSLSTQVRNFHDNSIINYNNSYNNIGALANTSTIIGMAVNSHYNINVYNNRISSLSGYASTSLNGLFTSGTAINVNIYNNIVDTLTSNAAVASGLSYAVAGALSTSIHDNVFSNITTAGTGAQNASGIFITSGGRNLSVYKNKTYNIRTNSTAGAYATGIFYNGIGVAPYSLTPASFHHNLISGIFAPTSTLTSSPPVTGTLFALSSPSGWPMLQFAYNTVLLTGTTASNVNSYAFCFGTVTTFTSGAVPAIKMNNNIGINLITPAGTGSAIALTLSTTTTAILDNSSNNNVYYAGTPSSTHLLFNDGTNKPQTIAAYKTFMFPKENASMSENVVFTSTNGTSSSYLMADATLATVIADAGTPISNITTDYVGNTLSTSNPDIGSYEGFYPTNDLTAPAITITPLTNTGMTYSPISFNATIKDLTGVDNNNVPLVYYKKSSQSSYTYSSGTLVAGTIYNGTWNFSIDPNNLGGLALGDIVNYFVVAQDITGTVNTGSAPFGAIATSIYSITTNPTPYSFSIVGGLSGNYTVCASGCDFKTLSVVNGAFDSINKSAITGDVTLTIAGDLNVETGAIGINQIAQNGTYKVSIVPDGTTERLIAGNTGASGTSGLIVFNGGDRITIDGRYNGSGSYLRFRNRSVNGCTVKFTNDSHLDTVRYAFIEGITNSVGTVFFTTPGLNGTGNDSNAVMYCDIRDTLGNGNNASTSLNIVQNTALYCDGHNNSENTIAYNNIFNFIYQGVNIASGLAGNENWVIDHNSFYQGPAASAKAGNVGSVSTQAIQLSSGQGHRITNNSIGGSAPDRSGAPFRGGYLSTGAMSFYGIQLANSAIGLDRLTTISGNTISNIDANPFGGSNQFGGIVVSGGYVSVTGNTIGGGAMPYDTIKDGSYSTTNCGGIVLAGGLVTVDGNTISNISNYLIGAGLTGVRTAGINIAGSGAAVNKYIVSNNIVHDIRSNYNYFTSGNLFTAQGTSPVGILNATGTGVVATIEDNTIYNIINTQVGVMGTANMAYGITIRGGINTVQRNKIYNISGLGNGTGNNSNFVYGIFINATTTTPIGQIIRNNQITLNPSATDASQLFGILDASTAICTNSIYNNSIFVGGTASGSNNSYALSIGNTNSYTTTNAYNNILYNMRNGGTGKHYAMGSYFISTGITSNTLNYNLMVTPSTSAMLEMPAGTSLGVSEINSMFTSKGNTNWMTTPSTLPSASLFANVSTGDLSINSSNVASWYANGKGIALASVTNDYNKASRSTSIAGGATDIGAVEFTTSTTPASATASAAPALSTTTSYTFAGRQVASITWGATGTVPTSVDVKYYSGTPAPSLHASMKTYNGYYTVTPTGGTGYTYDMSINYDSSMLGNVPNTNLARMARSSSSVWSNLSASVANAITNMFSSNTSMAASTLPAKFTLTDTTSIPLSSVDLSLTAFLQGLYQGSSTMTSSPFNADGTTPTNIADTITVELHDASTQALSYSVIGTISTSGTGTFTFPAGVNGNSYYISVRHRNSIQTWSTAPVLMNPTGTTYNFSTAATQAAGSNLVNDGSGVYMIYTGDINQDGAVDFNDYPSLDIASSSGVLGYDSSDLNGDASVDFNDYPMIDINSSNGVLSTTP